MFGWVLKFVIKPYLPYIMDYGMKLFKWDKTLDYVEKPNELDVQMMDIEKKCTDIGFKVTAMQGVIKELDANSHPEKPFEDRISKLEEFEKSIRNKKVFKSLNVK